MGVLIRNTETGYEVTLDTNVAKEIVAQMKWQIMRNATLVAATQVLIPEVAKFAAGVYIGQCAMCSVCISEPFETGELAQTLAAVTKGEGKFLANGDVQEPYEIPEILGGKSASPVKRPSDEPSGGTFTADEFLRAWEPPTDQKN